MTKVSILMLTMNRFELTKRCFTENMVNAGPEFWKNTEILIADNGSTDPRVVEWGRSLAHYHRANKSNEGVSKAFNQLLVRSKGDIIVLLGNDLINGAGWMETGIRYSENIPNAGILGFDWGHGHTPELSKKNGVTAHWLNGTLNRVFGTWMIRRRVIDEIGFFFEGFDVYGLEDSDFNERVNLAGFNSCYVPGIKSNHVGTGVHDDGDYREMKNRSMAINAGIFGERAKKFQSLGIREPLPEARLPL